MNPLPYLYLSVRNLAVLFSGKSMKNKMPAYQPHKSRINIFFDHLRSIILYGTFERGYWMYGFQNKSRKQQQEYIPYAAFMRERNRLNAA